jgi:hypothetical protein
MTPLVNHFNFVAIGTKEFHDIFSGLLADGYDPVSLLTGIPGFPFIDCPVKCVIKSGKPQENKVVNCDYGFNLIGRETEREFVAQAMKNIDPVADQPFWDPVTSPDWM